MCGCFMIERPVTIKASCVSLPATFEIAFDATFHVGKQVAPQLRNEPRTPQLLGQTNKASDNKRKQCIMLVILLCGEFV